MVSGAVCRLYFDIEYNLEMNPSTVSISVLETFIEVYTHTYIDI